jgi:hypothetical protein
LSDDPAIESFAERKAELRRQIDEFGGWALAVDAADKVAKVRELRMRAHDDRRLLTAQEGQLKLEHYWATLEMLEARDAAPSLTRQLRFELEMKGRFSPPHGAERSPHGARPAVRDGNTESLECFKPDDLRLLGDRHASGTREVVERCQR